VIAARRTRGPIHDGHRHRPRRPRGANRKDSAPAEDLDPERVCGDAGTLFGRLDCCDAVHPPGQRPYLVAMDQCACTTCPTCAGSELRFEDGGTPQSSSCAACADETRDHFGAKSCHPAAQAECNKEPGCVASQKCTTRFKCLSRPVQ
jgi:hypothetical protein